MSSRRRSQPWSPDARPLFPIGLPLPPSPPQASGAHDPENAAAVRAMLEDLDSRFSDHLPTYGAREVSMAVWAWGNLAHVPSPPVWKRVREAILATDADGPRGKGGDWGGESVIVPEAGVPGAAARDRRVGRRGPVSWLMSSATPQGLAMMSWGLYQMRWGDPCQPSVAVLSTPPHLRSSPRPAPPRPARCSRATWPTSSGPTPRPAATTRRSSRTWRPQPCIARPTSRARYQGSREPSSTHARL